VSSFVSSLSDREYEREFRHGGNEIFAGRKGGVSEEIVGELGGSDQSSLKESLEGVECFVVSKFRVRRSADSEQSSFRFLLGFDGRWRDGEGRSPIEEFRDRETEVAERNRETKDERKGRNEVDLAD